MRKIKFSRNFASRQKGEEVVVDDLLASQLVRGNKVAKYVDLKEREEAQKKAEKEKRIEKMKEDLITPNQYRKEKLQPVINEIVRIIDNGQPCICRPNEIATDAGHFFSTGSNLTLSLNLHNIHGQCRNSNGFKGGESLKYYKGLIRVYGKEYAEFCDQLQQCEPLKLTVQEMKEARKRLMEYRLELKKTITKPLDKASRILYRDKANDIARIYPEKYSTFQVLKFKK